MTEQEIAGLGPAFAAYLGRYRNCFLQKRTAAHFDNYCRGLLSDLPRKTVEPIALEAGTAVRTLQEFLTTARWHHPHVRDLLQRQLAQAVAEVPADTLGTVAIIDETSCRKWGDETPGVQRQYLGCVGKVDNGIVTVPVGVAKGRFQALLDAELYLPKVWDADRQRCRAAGIPDEVRYRPKWRIALEQLIRLHGNGITFDWLTSDEGYSAAVACPQRHRATLRGRGAGEFRGCRHAGWCEGMPLGNSRKRCSQSSRLWPKVSTCILPSSSSFLLTTTSSQSKAIASLIGAVQRHRATGRPRHHVGVDGAASLGRPASARGGRARQMPEQFAATRPGVHDFWSLHPGGANFLFADGAVHFLPYSARPILPALASRADGETTALLD